MSKTYKILANGSVQDKRTLLNRWYEYDDYTIPVDNSVYFDAWEAFLNWTNLDVNALVDVDLDELYKVNADMFEQRLEDKTNLDDFYSNKEVTSLIYFGEFDELIKMYEQKYFRDDDTILDEEHDIEETDVIKVNYANTVPLSSSNQKKNKHHVGFSDNSARDKHKKDEGLKGEYKVYNWLVEHFDEVSWVSENSKIAKVNPLGSAEYGYDISYRDGDIEYYVDVKASKSASDEFVFYMSSSELKFACEHEEQYRLFYVANVLSNTSTISILDNVIKDGVLNEQAFTVKADTKYTIKGKLSASSAIEE